ncbi:unnamed protein product, partial [Ixodes pacificus]
MDLAARDGGLGCLNIERVTQEVQLKALARLIRLGNRAVDHLLNTTMGPYHCRLASQLRSRKDWWRKPRLPTRTMIFSLTKIRPWGTPGCSMTRGTLRTETASRR